MKKDKSAASPSGNYEAKSSSSSSSNKVILPEEEDESKKQQTSNNNNNDFPVRTGTRNGSSKYDFVKVFVVICIFMLIISLLD